MGRYRNLSGDSGVVAYQTAPGSIAVEFRNGMVYLYTHRSAGRARIEKMKSYAAAGKGLSTYISKYVRDAYETRLR